MAYTGNGTVDNPYLVNNPDDFKYLFGLDMNGIYIKLISDINFDNSSNTDYAMGKGPSLDFGAGGNVYVDGAGYSIYNLTKDNTDSPTIKKISIWRGGNTIFKNVHFKNVYKQGNMSSSASPFLGLEGGYNNYLATITFIGCTVDIVSDNDNCSLTKNGSVSTTADFNIKFYKCTLNFINYNRYGSIVFNAFNDAERNIEIIDSYINITGIIRNISTSTYGNVYDGLILGSMKFIRCLIRINVSLHYTPISLQAVSISLLGNGNGSDTLMFQSSAISINIINIADVQLITSTFNIGIRSTGSPTIIVNENNINMIKLNPSFQPSTHIITREQYNDEYLTSIGFKTPQI